MARPAEFDRMDVLEKAMNVFWRTGYTATSISDLVEATSLKPGSLYGAFKSKRDLFLEVIDTYAERSLIRIQAALNSSDSPLDNIEYFYTVYCTDLQNDEIGQGCLLVNTMLELATEDEMIHDHVSQYLDRVELLFCDTITKAIDQGQLDKSTNPEDTATYLISSVLGLRVLSSKRPPAEKYKSVVRTIIGALFTPKH